MLFQLILTNISLILLTLLLKYAFFGTVPFPPIPPVFWLGLVLAIFDSVVIMLWKLLKGNWQTTLISINKEAFLSYFGLLLFGTIMASAFFQSEDGAHFIVNLMMSVIAINVASFIVLLGIGFGNNNLER